MDIAEWLRGLGLERYAVAFRDNEIDWEALPKLTAEDLQISASCSGDIAANCSRQSQRCEAMSLRSPRQ